MSKTFTPELKKYMDKNLCLKLNGSRKVYGVLRGYDDFMNLVLDQAYEQISESEKIELGSTVVRGNSVIVIEALDPI
ncbi:hypothetical protein BB560_002335 [Smittium megazygosporum]|uniref:Small nuclear ribonucleoprotein G n=1 Tax=Smittium megazygosporum TaxID=133381 RepID=A0A2T9ZF24_9FUNG|nr:hypothetical protein BB560_002335 [Smittium megazygosporum]